MVSIVLDPGHGGTTKVGGSSPNNATGPTGLLEKEVTLRVAFAARDALAGSGVEVVLTRDTDRNLGIDDRARVAQDLRAAAFVSIHFNAAPADGPAAQGTETWIGVGHTALSRDLAEAVQRDVLAVTGHRNRGVKVGAVSGVINPARHDPQTAACLVEISFLDRQPEEERKLRGTEYVGALGAALARAILRHLRGRGLAAGRVEAAVAEAEDAASAMALGTVPLEDAAAAAAMPLEDRMPAPAVPIALPVETGGATGEEPPLPDPTGRPGTDVAFIDTRPGQAERPFSDLRGAAPVDSPAAMLDGWRQVRTEGPGGEPGLTVEAAVGRFMTLPAALLELLARRRRAVARIRAAGTDYRGVRQDSAWMGTGFLVAENLLLTNHHVLNSAEVAAGATVEFDYEVPADRLSEGIPAQPADRRVFRVDPRRLFLTSPVTGGLDFTFVWIDREAASAFGTIPMERASFTVKPGEQAFVIHHPQGKPKQVSVDDTDVLKIQSTVIHYASDTEYGSSGAPVFDRQGRLIALHHARQEMTVELPEGGTTDVVNEGIKIAAIAVDLENRVKRGGPDAAMAQIVLAAMKGSDSLTGFFGSLGRKVGAGGGAEAVVDAYQGSGADLDIGFWNIEWLANRYRDAQKLRGVARVIVDLNLDLWGLSEVSPPAVQALVEEIRATFGEDYAYGLSEPDAPEGKQSTAVIWKRATLRGDRVPWPTSVEPLLHLRSDDPRVREEAVQGRIFDRYPGLFRFELASRLARFDFHLVPLHLKAMAEGSLRRRLASRILARAVEALIAESGDADVILGGDVNASLASGDFDALLRDGGLTALAAADEAAGGFSYIKGPRSLIDNIFLSPNLSRIAGPDDFFVVAKDRSMDDYVGRISDHRPILVRFSLAEQGTPAPASATPGDLDALIADLLRNQAGGDPAPAPKPARPSRRR